MPLLFLHSGLRWGGTLSTTLMALLLLVVASGIFGLVLQQFLPRRLLNEYSTETVYGQIDAQIGQLAEEGERLVAMTCGPKDAATAEKKEQVVEAGRGYVTVGPARAAGRGGGKPGPAVAESEALREFFVVMAGPYLRAGDLSGSALCFPDRATAYFEGLRERLSSAAHPAAAALEELCQQRRLFDAQARLHFWLHSWLCVHLPLSGSLLFLMIVHVVFALKYW